MVSVPLGDLATIPKTTGAAEAHTYVPLSRGTVLVARAARALAQVGLRAPLGKIGEAVAGSGPEGPTAEERTGTEFVAVARARSGSQEAHATITGRDPYGLTAYTAAFAARTLAEPSYDRAGWLSPMTAIDPAKWEALLGSIGASITVRS
jgi:hypothetical protein